MTTNGNGAVFEGYEPTTDFERRVLVVLDDLVHGLARLETQVSANTRAVLASTNAVLSMRQALDDVANEMRILSDAAQVARAEAGELAREAAAAREAARRATSERPTDPDLRRQQNDPVPDA